MARSSPLTVQGGLAYPSGPQHPPTCSNLFTLQYTPAPFRDMLDDWPSTERPSCWNQRSEGHLSQLSRISWLFQMESSRVFIDIRLPLFSGMKQK